VLLCDVTEFHEQLINNTSLTTGCKKKKRKRKRKKRRRRKRRRKKKKKKKNMRLTFGQSVSAYLSVPHVFKPDDSEIDGRISIKLLQSYI